MVKNDQESDYSQSYNVDNNEYQPSGPDTGEQYNPDEDTTVNSKKKEKVTFAQRIRNLNTRLNRKVDTENVKGGASEIYEKVTGKKAEINQETKAGKFIKTASETAGAAGDLLGTLMGTGKQSQENKYDKLVKQAEPYIQESIEYEVSKVKRPEYPKDPTPKNLEKYNRAIAQYEGYVKDLRERKKREFEMRSPLSKAYYAGQKMQEMETKKKAVEGYLQSQQVREMNKNPIAQFLQNSKKQENFEQLYRQKSNNPAAFVAREIEQTGKKYQKPMPGFQPPMPLESAAGAFMSNNPIMQQERPLQQPMRRPMKQYGPPQAYSQPYSAPPMPIQQPGMGMQPPQPVQDIPNHRMMPPAYTAPHPWLAPDEYPPFGDNPQRNFAEKNLDHPLFQSNKPKGRNPLFDEPNQGPGFLW